jgi:soluble lytic murein transglycosylase
LRAAAWLAGQPEAWVREDAPKPAEAAPAAGANDQQRIARWLQSWAGPGTLELPQALRTSGDWQRAQELLSVGRRGEALVQLERLRRANEKNPWTLTALSLAFRDLGAHRLSLLAAEGVISLSGKTLRDTPPALQRLAYPMPYEDLVRQEARRQNLDPRLLSAIMRQESRFEAGVASVAGAQGLMQVMPGTAEGIARQMQWPNFEASHAYYPYVNVAFGAFYVRQWLSHFDGSVFAALAAYNGGPGNAGPWYNEAPDDEDLFAANININETRVYIQAVWQNYEAYRRLYPR